MFLRSQITVFFAQIVEQFENLEDDPTAREVIDVEYEGTQHEATIVQLGSSLSSLQHSLRLLPELKSAKHMTIDQILKNSKIPRFQLSGHVRVPTIRSFETESGDETDYVFPSKAIRVWFFLFSSYIIIYML